ncbi:MAG: LPS assembly lipoprotein LptE [Candidatus Omnitrophota bacterium]|nr:LPS assembly lipoprotein LptE [Candidatus Omnitrophota bacterium]
MLAFAGCGYTTKTALPENIRTIHVDTFKNSIDITKEVSAKDKYEVYRPNLEVDLRDAIVNRVFLDGNFKMSDKGSADAILEGEILQYRKDPLRYQNEIVQEYRISIVCDIKLAREKDSTVLFEERNITGDTAYFTTGALQKTESSALSDAMADLARRIVNRIVENW